VPCCEHAPSQPHTHVTAQQQAAGRACNNRACGSHRCQQCGRLHKRMDAESAQPKAAGAGGTARPGTPRAAARAGRTGQHAPLTCLTPTRPPYTARHPNGMRQRATHPAGPQQHQQAGMRYRRQPRRRPAPATAPFCRRRRRLQSRILLLPLRHVSFRAAVRASACPTIRLPVVALGAAIHMPVPVPRAPLRGTQRLLVPAASQQGAGAALLRAC